MTNYVQLTDLNAPVNATSATLLPSFGDALLVRPGVVITNSSAAFGSTAILCAAENQRVFLDGIAYGFSGIRSNFNNASIFIGDQGHAAGTLGYAVHLEGTGHEVFNDGLISGEGGVYSAGRLTLRNEGNISSSIGINTDGGLDLVNTGTITGTTVAITGSIAVSTADNIINAGTIVGDVYTSNLDDLYDGRDGQLRGRLFMGDGNDTALGGDGNDRIFGGRGSDEIDTGGGNDAVIVDIDRASDTLDGGDGIDTLDASTTIATSIRVNLTTGILRGSDTGNDLITGFEHARGGSGSDTITGDAAANRLWGGNGNDTLLGGSGNDRLDGGADIDRLDGGEGNDRLLGREGTDTLLGGNGDDTITGGNGIDRLTGGGGNDLFMFNTREEINTLFEFTSGITERITDFNTNGDIIDLSGIDRDSATVEDDSFTFVGGAAITGAGQVAVRQSGGNTFIDLSFSSSTVVARIQLDGLIALDAGDFVL